MIKKERFIIILLALLVVTIIYSLPSLNAANVCCEKTLSGAICQDTDASNCAPGATQNPTSCSQTSFCKLGTCIDKTAGECKPNTPQKTCDAIGGFWDSRGESEIPACQKVCCYLGEQTMFVTQTECKKESGFFGFETVFDKSITDSITCFASGISEDKGACVFQEEEKFGKACEFITEKQCREKRTAFPELNVEFFKDYLCSAEELDTTCAPSRETTCNNEMVYFKDTCGNIANIYDASKLNDNAYWSKIIEPQDSCGAGKSNANSQTCGNCNYNSGSTCSEAKRSETAIPTAGDYICRDLSCEYDSDGDKKMEKYFHGEKWCASFPGTSKITEDKEAITNSSKENLPGSRYVVLSCNNGEVDYEECADMREEVCIEHTIYPDSVTPFRNAKCSINEWRGCETISSKEDCENVEKRDCKWIPTLARTDDDRLTTWTPNEDGDAAALIKTDSDLPKGKSGDIFRSSISAITELIKKSLLNIKTTNYNTGSGGDVSFQNGACVPKYAPGFDFMGKVGGVSNETRENVTKEAQDRCSLGSVRCIIKYEKDVGGTWKAVENSECEPDPNGPYLWYESMKNICVSLGDCAYSIKTGDKAAINYIEKEGDQKMEFKGPQ